MKTRLLGTVIGGLCGSTMGAGTGIVGAFGGVGGLFVFMVLGGVIGFFAAPDFAKVFQRIMRLVKRGS